MALLSHLSRIRRAGRASPCDDDGRDRRTNESSGGQRIWISSGHLVLGLGCSSPGLRPRRRSRHWWGAGLRLQTGRGLVRVALIIVGVWQKLARDGDQTDQLFASGRIAEPAMCRLSSSHTEHVLRARHRDRAAGRRTRTARPAVFRSPTYRRRLRSRPGRGLL
jgi:hypothetical protein